MLQIHSLTLTRANRTLCSNLSLEIKSGETWAILGPNGCGKTTLLLTLAGLLPTQSGAIQLDQQAITGYSRKALAQKLGILFQHQEDAFPLTVREIAEQACFPHHALWQSPTATQHQAIEQAIHDYELHALAERDIRTLSGGERQRVALACLQVQNPALWLLDEPTNHLDIPHQLRLLQRLKVQGRTAVVMTLHDVNQATRVATHALLMLPDGK